jgi:hypothetical protein
MSSGSGEGREECAPQERGRCEGRSERLEVSGVFIGCGSGLVAILGETGSDGTRGATTTRKSYELSKR